MTTPPSETFPPKYLSFLDLCWGTFSQSAHSPLTLWHNFPQCLWYLTGWPSYHCFLLPWKKHMASLHSESFSYIPALRLVVQDPSNCVGDGLPSNHASTFQKNQQSLLNLQSYKSSCVQDRKLRSRKTIFCKGRQGSLVLCSFFPFFFLFFIFCYFLET